MADCLQESACSKARGVLRSCLAVNFYQLRTTIRIGQFDCDRILPEWFRLDSSDEFQFKVAD